MSRILFALLCSIAINAQAGSLTHAKSSARTGAVQAEKPASLPSPSKASLGFYLAAINANYDMMDVYLQQGANINCLNCDRDYQMTALYRALGVNGGGNYQLADWLIQRGADINIPATIGQFTGSTLVMSAAGYSNVPNFQALDYLVKHGVDVKAKDSIGRTALHYIREWNFIDSPYGDISKQFVAFIDILVKYGIDVNGQDKSGTTALMNATNYCSPGAVKLLISYGENTTLKDKLGKSALDFAMDRATQSGQNSPCNEVAKILSKSPQSSRAASTSSYANSKQQSAAINADTYVGTYGGTYSGLDEGVFQADIFQDGTATFHLHSNKSGGTTTHEGNVNNDGSVLFGKPGIGAVFVGRISREGILAGTWLAPDNDKGDFQGQKGVQVEVPGINAAQFLGSLFK